MAEDVRNDWKAAGLVALAVGGVAAALAFGRMSPVWGMLATAVALVCGTEGIRRSGPPWLRFAKQFPGLSRTFRHAAPWALLAVLLLWALWPLPAGEMPINQDHAHHLLATDILVNDFIREFRLFGWTDRVSGGLPFGDVYPTLAYLVTGAANLVTFGLVPLEVSYAWGIVFVWAVGIAAVGLWGRKLARETQLRFAAVASVVAGAAYLFDVGGGREGGWVYHMFHAVWPQQLATATLFLGLFGLFWMVDRPTTRRLGLVAIAIGVGVWLHPMVAINLALLTPLAVLVLALDPRDDSRGRVVWSMVTLLAGAIIAMFWFSHLLSAADVMRSNIAYWDMLGEMGAKLWRGGLFENGHVVVGILALIGVGVAVVRGGRLGLFTVLAFVVLLLFGGMNLLAQFDVGFSEHNRLFMYRRVAITVKPLYFAFAGLGASAVVTAAVVGGRRLSSARPRWISIAMLVVVSPLLWAMVASMPSLVRGPTARILTAEGAGLDKDLDRLQEILEEHAPPEGMRRAVYWTQGGQQGDYALIPMAHAGYGYLPTRRPPAQVFSRINEGHSLKEMAFAGATILVSRSKRKRDGLKLIEKLDSHYVYRIEHPKPSTYPVKMRGPGEVEVMAWEDQRQVLKISGASKKSRLIIGRPTYDEWEAEQDGRSLKMRRFRAARGYAYTSIAAVENGTVTIEYRHSIGERIAFWIGLLMLLGCAGLIIWNRPLPPWPSNASGQRRLAIAAIATTGVVVVAALIVLDWLGDEGLEHEWARKGEQVVKALHQVEPAFEYAPRPDCIRPYTRDPHDRCIESELYPRLSLAARRKKTVVPTCVRFGVPEKGSAKLTWELPESTTRVAGRLHGNRVANRLDVTLRSGKSKRELEPDDRPFGLKKLPSRRLVLELENPAKRTADLCLELVALTR